MRNREFRRKSTINHQLEKGHLNFHCRNIKSGFDKEKLIMKRCIKGGFLVLGGVVGVVGMIIAAMQNPSATPQRAMVSLQAKMELTCSAISAHCRWTVTRLS